MLTKTITYTDYNDKRATEKLYFNLTQTEMADLLEMMPTFKAWAERAENEPDRDLTTEETLSMFALIKELVKMSYGIRSEDGKRFIKDDLLFMEFTQTAAYDAFIMGMFASGGDGLLEFMRAIIPASMRDSFDDSVPKTTETVELPQPVIEQPAYITEDREPTQDELIHMTPAQLQEAFRRKSQK